jgi:transcriptional regulator with XRE-family HTH domain
VPVVSSDNVYTVVGKRVRAGRAQVRLTQDQLAQRVGLTRSSITNLELGRQKIQVHTLCAIADALRLPVTSLLPDKPTAVSSTIKDELKGKHLDPAERAWAARILNTGSRLTLQDD